MERWTLWEVAWVKLVQSVYYSIEIYVGAPKRKPSTNRTKQTYLTVDSPEKDPFNYIEQNTC